MIPLLLVRHGKTEWNLEKRIQGRRDIPLSETGRKALDGVRIPARFRAFKWVSSPLKRAEETALLLGAQTLHIEPRIIEMDWGDWDGKTLSELRALYGEEMRRNEAKGLQMQPPAGESPAMVQERLRPWLKELSEPTIAVTHKGIIRALKSLAYNWDMTEKAPVPFDWSCAHLFKVDPSGRIYPDRVNIPLETS
ncbi:histidine phosphatase family protein [Sneathiella sp.]|jgi:broad specificity phosphatase PhoE|uniref:histidine phosphatase family protein n=1 Tax=Sneathiella sp. TaxID=1964365 RepID=UPI0039E5F8C8